MDTKTINLDTLNSATKYPSILTYHVLGEKGRLTDARHIEPQEGFVVTEKIDGTNTRLIFMPDGMYLIGSREHLLYASGDLIGNPALGIVESIKPLADRVNSHIRRDGASITVLYLETYGGKTTAAAKNYTSDQSFGHRMFDLVTVTPETLERSTQDISAWRENGGQSFADETELNAFSKTHDVELTQRLTAPVLPTTHQGVLDWLETVIPSTFASLDGNAKMAPEGVVVRSADRRDIAKIRYANYRRTLKSR